MPAAWVSTCTAEQVSACRRGWATPACWHPTSRTRFHPRDTSSMPTLADAIRDLPRPVWLEIDVDALRNNVGVVREIVGPNVQISAVVKADGYGHGMLQSAFAFEAAGASRLCVASLDEALALRDAGIKSPLLVLYPVPADRMAAAAAQNVELTVTEPVAGPSELVVQ